MCNEPFEVYEATTKAIYGRGPSVTISIYESEIDLSYRSAGISDVM